MDELDKKRLEVYHKSKVNDLRFFAISQKVFIRNWKTFGSDGRDEIDKYAQKVYNEITDLYWNLADKIFKTDMTIEEVNKECEDIYRMYSRLEF